jgi:hypothetical protein
MILFQKSINSLIYPIYRFFFFVRPYDQAKVLEINNMCPVRICRIHNHPTFAPPKKYFYTEFHENPTDRLDTGSRSRTDGRTDGLGFLLRPSHYLLKLLTNLLGRAALWCEQFRKFVSFKVFTMRVAPFVAFVFGSYTA